MSGSQLTVHISRSETQLWSSETTGLGLFGPERKGNGGGADGRWRRGCGWDVWRSVGVDGGGGGGGGGVGGSSLHEAHVGQTR